MTATAEFKEALEACPLVTILRGVQTEEVEAIGDALVEAGLRLIEVPLNSPDPLRSIERLAQHLGDSAIVGAGTVLAPEQVGAVRDAGGRLIVSPNTNVEVIARTVREGLVSLPGFQTPSEAFEALEAGAHGLKLFPAEAASPRVLKALRAVLPADVPVLPVGGIEPGLIQPWLDAGANGFGLGSALYQPGMTAEMVALRARTFMEVIRASAA